MTESGGSQVVGVCLACLRVRGDVDGEWLARESAEKKRTTYFCDDDFAFPGRCKSRVDGGGAGG